MANCEKLLPLLLVLLTVNVMVRGASECGRTPVEMEAFNLAPCAGAGQDEKAQVSSSCCFQVKTIGQNPACLCAVMLSRTARDAGVRPEVAITIPKRCNLANRPTGYKCGAYTMP
ncbi:uncharacterized protein LOC116254765 [Nymphaea colorata]|uniref:uncharacterized protein LOC116254765 n=1 Tax=Nymphaea colorata TaxID=210225 RepID=UPI00129E56A5|nr:uncharacterized protein LOC116254765 [Nymphaea colorata]